MNRKKSLTALTLAFLTLLGGTAFSQTTELRISILAWMTGKYQLDDAAKHFEADHPGVKVVITKLDTVDTTSNLLQWSQGKTTIDLALGGSRENIVPYAARKLIVPFDTGFFNDKIKKSDFIPSLLELGNIEGTQYMIPMMGEVLFIVVNKTLMKKAGLVDAHGNIKPPATLDELYDYAKKTTIVENGKVVQTGLSIDWGANFMAYNFLVGLQGQKGSIYGADGKTIDVAGPAARNLLNFWQRLVKDGLTPTDSFSDVDAGRSNFKAGKVAMHITAASRWVEAGDILGADNVTVLPIPGTGKNGSLAYIHGAIIPRLSPNQELAKDFIREQLLDKGFQTYSVNTYGKMSPLVSHYDAAKAPEWKMVLTATQKAATSPLYKDFPKLDAYLQVELQKAITNRQTVDATLANLSKFLAGIDKSTGLK
jgi:ABC-type glycerol-3-phosphate transport system substrate-binding protein